METRHDAETAAEAATGDSPTAARERIVALDFIRGVAVLGILVANINAFAHPVLAIYWPGILPGGGTASDHAAWLAQFVAIDGKFRGLFTLLFGAGMALFAERSADPARQAWRLLWLLLFGLAHFYLLFVGDILILYAIAGFVAILAADWEARTQLFVGLAWWAAGSLLMVDLLYPQVVLEANEVGTPMAQALAGVRDAQIAEALADRAAYMHGSLTALIAYRWEEQSVLLWQLRYTIIVETVPLMLIGMGLYRLGFFAPGQKRTRWRWWGWAGVIGSAIVSFALGRWAMISGFPLFLTAFVFSRAGAFPQLPMILGLAALLTLAVPAASGGWLGARIVAAGRMAFSNYVGTSLVMALIFQGWAGGLFGRLGRVELLPFVLLGWVLMLAWSKPWLDHFRYGPLEWLWRCLTYGRVLPLRRK